MGRDKTGSFAGIPYKTCTLFQYLEYHNDSGNPVEFEELTNIFGESFRKPKGNHKFATVNLFPEYKNDSANASHQEG